MKTWVAVADLPVKVKPVAGASLIVDGTHSTSGGNGSILTPGAGDGTGTNAIIGADTNVIVNDGQLLVDNVIGARDGITHSTLSHISGAGSVTQLGSAPLTLLGFNTYVSGTSVLSGTLLVGADTSLGTGPVTNGGILATAGAQRDIIVTGALTQQTAGTLRLNASGAGSAAAVGTVRVGGRATLAGALVISAGADFAPMVGRKFVVVQAVGGVTGTFASISVAGSGAKVSSGYDATTAFVTAIP